MHRFTCCAFASLLLGTGIAPAGAVALGDSVQVHGFFSQAYVRTTANDYYGSSDAGGTFNLRETGVNVSWLARPELLFAAQAVARWAGDADDGSPSLDYALADWTPWMSPAGRAGVRLGRVKIPFGLYNETRDVAHTRPGIVMPGVYFDTARNLLLSLDGAGAYLERTTRAGDFKLDVVAGKPRSEELDDLPSISAALTDTDIGGARFARLLYDSPGGALRGALTYAAADLELTASSEFGALRADVDVAFFGVSAQWAGAAWQLTAEHFWRRFETRLAGMRDTTWSPGWYAQASWAPAPRWGLYLRYEASYLDGDDRSGRNAQAMTGLPRHLTFQKDWTAGLRYDVTARLRLAAEAVRGDGVLNLFGTTEASPAATHRRWNALLLQAAMRF